MLCFIDSLGGGGTQRQMVTLACPMAEFGHQIEVLSYHPEGFFAPSLAERGIPWRSIAPYPMLTRLRQLRREFRTYRGEVVLAFLEGPSLYAEVLGGFSRHWGLVVSERAAYRTGAKTRCLRLFHSLTDYVVSNSRTTERAIGNTWPGLRSRARCIYNVVDLDRFSPCADRLPPTNGPLRLATVANYTANKNVVGIVDGLVRALRQGARFKFDWFGWEAQPEVADQARQVIREAGLESELRLNPQTTDAAAVYRKADGVLLGSFAEGLPNAVCEGMACGLPVLMSDISDARYLVEEGVNGFLFDPHRPNQIADRIGRLAALSPEQRAAMGRASRRKAEQLFDRQRNTRQYLDLLEAAWRKRNGNGNASHR